MIDAHIDQALRKKITDFEFIDFSRLVSKNRFVQDDDNQRLEIVNKNGLSYLSPVSDREGVTINSYIKWEQAFRVYSNVLTSKYPSKSTELLQYDHTIHTASTTYAWDNVYAYNREFRNHIARHPYRSWSIILQQAWTMLLKDRVSKGDSLFQKGNNWNKGDKGTPRRDYCKRFQWGKCHYGLSCKFEHRCAMPKCGKFGCGAHICRLRQQDSQENSSSSSSSYSKNSHDTKSSTSKHNS